VFIPAGLAGFVVHDLQFGFTPWTIARLISADTIEILIVGLGLGYCFDEVPRLNSSKALAKYCFFAVFLGPFASGFFVASAVSGSYRLNWRIWFFSQALAFLTLTPAILSWANANHGSGFRGSLQSKVEAAALIGGLALLGYFVLLFPWKMMPSALIFSFVPFLLWAALRFGSMGVSTSMIVISFLSIWGAIHGHGPFAGPEPFQNVLSLQLFLMFAAIPYMVLAAMAEERERDQKALSNVSHQLIKAQEEERTWIARELHDDINQQLALLHIALDQLKQDRPRSLAQLRSRMEELANQASEISKGVQALSHRLHSSKLEYLGLVSAMQGFCREFADQHQVEVRFSYEQVPDSLPRETSLCLFRILQAALTNALKHSGVRCFEARLYGTPSGVHLTVRDQGAGFDPEQVLSGQGIGLISMRERVRLVNGKISIQSKPNGGTTIAVDVPLSKGRANALRASA